MSLFEATSRRKLYSFTFMVSGLMIGLSGLFAVWGGSVFSGVFVSVLLTLLILLGASAILFVLTFAQDDQVSKKSSFVIGLCTALISLSLIGDIWFDIFDNIFLAKASFSLFVIACLAGFVLSVWDDFFENKRLKDENYLD